jgi:hypothetical protein
MIAVPAFRLVYLLTVRIVAWGSRPPERVGHAGGGSDRQPGGGLAPHAITTLAGTPDALWCSDARDGQAENGRVLVGSLGIKLLISGFLHMPCHVAYRPAVPPQVRTDGPPGAP